MSKPNYIEKLLEGVEVEWKDLGEVGELVRGNGLLKTDFTESGVPAIHYGQIYTYYGTFTTETKSFVSYETAKKLKKVDTGDVVITNTSENLEDVGKAVVYLGKVQAVTGGHATIFKPSNQISGKYFAYFTQTEMFASQKRKYAKGTKVIDVSATDMSKITIPIPPLKVQEEIVHILDVFTEFTAALIAALTAELTARKKQYTYYRNKLLTFEEGKVEWKTLGELLKPKGYIRGPFGSALKKEFFLTEGVPVYEQQHAIYDKRAFRYFIDNDRAKSLKRFTVQPNDIIISCSGTIGKISIITQQDRIGVINQALLILRLDLSKVSIKYIKHYLECFTNLIVSSTGGAITNIEKREVIEKIKMPIPSLSEQQRIVSILDKFDALTSSITEGLPREIELRQKQYEYYRDILLSFPKEEVEG